MPPSRRKFNTDYQGRKPVLYTTIIIFLVRPSVLTPFVIPQLIGMVRERRLYAGQLRIWSG